MLALAILDQRSEEDDAAALRHLLDGLNDLTHGLLVDLAAAAGAVGYADARIEEPQIVIDLGHCAHRGAGITAGALLVDADGGAEAVDLVDVRLLHLAQELACVGRQRLDIAPLSLGIEGVEGQR
jgi:hypothetical protein